jgi:hypothetical protein
MNETLDNELRELEAQLANLTPNQMPDDMLYRMEQAMIGWEDHLPVSPDDEKIVPFNSTDHSSAPTSSKSNLHVFGAAAAIALMASLAAVFMTGNTQNASVLAGGFTSPSSAVPIENSMVNNTLPELSRNITHASNEGITFAGKNEAPFKVLRIEYTEKVITHDKDGK